MKTPIRFMVVFLLTLLFVSCTLLPPGEQGEPTSTSAIAPASTPTPTTTPLPAVNPATPPPDSLSGTLEIRFPDPWDQPEFCTSEIPYELTLQGNAYKLAGKGQFYCYQFIVYEEGSGIKHHLIQDYAVSLSGSKPLDPEGILEVELTFEGEQQNYFSDMPPEVPEMITEANPFQVEIDQPLNLRFSYTDNAYCVWNLSGVFTSLPGEEPPLGENGWVFILHPQP